MTKGRLSRRPVVSADRRPAVPVRFEFERYGLVSRAGELLKKGLAIPAGAECVPLIMVHYRNGDSAELIHRVKHSPTGMEWGYAGSGPSDAALAVLSAVIGPQAAESAYQAFKWAFIAPLPYEGGVIEVAEILDWWREYQAGQTRK